MIHTNFFEIFLEKEVNYVQRSSYIEMKLKNKMNSLLISGFRSSISVDRKKTIMTGKLKDVEF